MRRQAVALLCAVVLTPAAACAADPKVEVFPSVGWGRLYRGVEWAPIELNITNALEEPTGVDLVIRTRQDELTSVAIHRPLVLVPGRSVDVRLVAKLAHWAEVLEVRVRDEKGRTLFSRRFDLMDFGDSSLVREIPPPDFLVGVTGTPAQGLMRIGRVTTSRGRADSEHGKVHLARKYERQLPVDDAGYQALDLLVLYRPVWRQMHVEQAQAIAEWVCGGGRLLLVGGPPPPEDSAIAELLPARPGAPARTTFHRGQLAALDLPGEANLDLWSLEGLVAAGWQPIRAAGGETLMAAGMVEFGKVGVLAFDPAEVGSLPLERQGQFWGSVFTELTAGRRITHEVFEEGSRYEQMREAGAVEAATNGVLAHLLSIEELRPMSIWTVLGLLAALAVVTGPANYLALKRLDRLPWTWVTTIGCIAVFSVAAYYGVQWVRGGRGQVRVVTLIDGIQGGAGGWRTTYAGIFAPSSGDYRLTGLDDCGWWSSVTPVAERSYRFDARQTGRRTLQAAQVDGANLPTRIPVSIWSMQCLLCEAPADRLHPLDVSWHRTGGGVSVTVANQSDLEIAAGELRIEGAEPVKLGSVRPGEKRTFNRTVIRGRAEWDPERIRYRYAGDEIYDGSPATRLREMETLYLARGAADRSAGMMSYLQRGAGIVCVEFDTSRAERAAVPFRLAGRDATYDHKMLARLVVFPGREDK